MLEKYVEDNCYGASTVSSVYHNDMPDVIAVLIKLHADDAKIYSRVSASVQKKTQVKVRLNKSINWATIWLMLFNFIKCRHLQIGKSEIDTRYSMKSGNKTYELKKVRTEKDLGVRMITTCYSETTLHQKSI